MTSRPTGTTLRSRYIEQAASDLRENRRRQQELAEKIKVLRQEEALLMNILNLAERFEPSADTTGTGALPARTQDGATGETPHRATTADAEGKPRQPLLGDVLMDLLNAHGEPRLAKELRDELLEKHPERRPTPQVVRNTLESLVAKGRIQRHKQQRSVMYSPTEPEPEKTAPKKATSTT
ncbi:BlaI/MecI/CopY family transcriptional regulator [Streptomyces sp. NPDC002561]|uniref:BlaI/MecI/CopY family transcriptional regulator n=1 Tax=Streptomyces sp. NPDC002561 TaxID=3154418 RepID=UPI00331D18C6